MTDTNTDTDSGNLNEITVTATISQQQTSNNNLLRKIDTYIHDLSKNNVSLTSTCKDLEELKQYIQLFPTKSNIWIIR
jgi:hypothetical protein